MLDRLVLELQVVSELVRVAWPRSDSMDYPDSVLAAPLSAQEEPQGATQIGIVLHSGSGERRTLFIDWR